MAQRTCYIGGPMRGYENFNFPAFDDGAEILRSSGWTVFSPAEHDRAKGFDETANTLDGFDLSAAFMWDFQTICMVDAVFVLPGWEMSEGTKVEVLLAQTLNKPVYELTAGIAGQTASVVKTVVARG